VLVLELQLIQSSGKFGLINQNGVFESSEEIVSGSSSSSANLTSTFGTNISISWNNTHEGFNEIQCSSNSL
jgi:hypothetical protein